MVIDQFSVITPLPLGGGKVVVVGAGGIGARVIPMLVKLLRPAGPTPTTPAWTIHVVDPDRVEERNLLRQPFVAGDVGEYKAEIMARRYHTAEVPVVAWTSTIQTAWSGVSRDGAENAILLGCVDLIAPRAWMVNALHSGDDGYLAGLTTYIDAGNDGNRGQVVLAAGHMLLRANHPDLHYHTTPKLTGAEWFADVFTGVDNAEPSCGVRIDTQTPLANNMAAALMLNYVGALLHAQPIGTIGMRFSTLGAVEMVRGRLNVRGEYARWQAADHANVDEKAYQTILAQLAVMPEAAQRAVSRLMYSRMPVNLAGIQRVHRVAQNIHQTMLANITTNPVSFSDPEDLF